MTSILALGNIIIKNEAKCLLEAVEKLLSWIASCCETGTYKESSRMFYCNNDYINQNDTAIEEA